MFNYLDFLLSFFYFVLIAIAVFLALMAALYFTIKLDEKETKKIPKDFFPLRGLL